MSEIFMLIEHRQDAIRDISYEMMTCGRALAEKLNTKLTAVFLGYDADKLVESIRDQAHRIMVVNNEVFKEFNAESYQIALAEIIKKENPLLTLIGHTAFGMDLCPALGTQLGIPFTTDCLDVEIIDGKLIATRQMYDGKLNAKIRFRKNPSYLVSLRTGCFPVRDSNIESEIVNIESPISAEPDYRKFVEYIEAAISDVDITKADVVVGVGRGIKKKENLALIEDFASTIGGVVACSRPIVDAEWLPKDRQVGSSGKTVKPKLYIALGISGAFQHVVGMKNSGTIIAINKDQNAPIFNEADYGIVDDLFRVLPTFKNSIIEMKSK